MTDNSRDRILARLRRAVSPADEAPATACLPIASYSRDERIARLRPLMEAVKTEVHVVAKHKWTDTLKSVFKPRRLQTLLYAPQTAIGPQLEAAWQDVPRGLPKLIQYEDSIESFKETLFKTDAAITTTAGAIAETGAIVLWPDTHEPRLMSLVPPLHIAVVDADAIYNSFCEIIQAQHWPDRMPANAVLISGPSKTADIEMTLAFGVHGPKELIVLILS